MSTLQCNDEANSNSTALTLENKSISEFSLSDSLLLTLTPQINALHWPHCVILIQGEHILHVCCLEAKKTVLVIRSGCGVSTPANGLTTSGWSFFFLLQNKAYPEVRTICVVPNAWECMYL